MYATTGDDRKWRHPFTGGYLQVEDKDRDIAHAAGLGRRDIVYKNTYGHHKGSRPTIDYSYVSTQDSTSWGQPNSGGRIELKKECGISKMDVKYSKAGEDTIVTAHGSR